MAGTATRNEDFFTATGTEGTVAVPAGGGSVTLLALTGNDDRFELPETFTVAVGRPQVPGERVTATVTILDNDPEPAVTISAAGPYSEHAGEISLNLRLERAAGAPLTYHVHTVDGTAQAAEDYVPVHEDVTIPVGQTEGPFVRVEIIDDALAYELDSEFFSVVIERSGFDNAVADIEIIDDDNIPQARFVRQPADPANQVLKRDLVEGTTSNPTLPLSVELTGAAITQPTPVTITAQSFTADQGSDFTLAPTTLVFQPGDGPKTVTLTSIGDAEVELDDVVIISMSTEAGDLLGRVDDEAQVTLLDDDDAVGADAAVEDFRSGWLDLLGTIDGWLRQFNLAPADAQAVVTPSLADFFGLSGLGDLGLPSPDPSAHTLAELCADLLAKGVTVDYVAGGLCGRPGAPDAGDIIQIRTAVTLADLAKAASFTGGSLNEASDGALQSLAAALGLDATDGWVGDLTVTLVVGVDADGFYVSADTDLSLGVSGTLTLGGTATAAGSPISVDGTATADLTVSLAPSTPRQRDLDALLVPAIDGDAAVTLGFGGLRVGDYALGGDLTLDFVDGSFIPSLGGGAIVDGPPDSIVSGAEVSLSGSLTAGDPTVIDVVGSVTLSGELPAGINVEDLELKVGVLFSFGSSGFEIEPRLEKADVGAITFPFGDIITLRAVGVEVDFAPPPGGNFLEVGEARDGLSVEFGDEFPVLAGWEGSFHNLALSADLVPRLLPNFGFDIKPADGERFGLPEFIPIVVREVGITFPDVVTDPPAGGLELTPALLAGMRLRISGGIEANATWPIGAEVDGLEVDLAKLTRGEFPITNLSGVSMGVEPFDLPGGVTIGGGLKLGTIDVDGKTVFYGRVFGDFSVADIGGGADLVVTQYGPVLMKVRAPLGIPLGPSGVVLAGVEGAARVRQRGHPGAPSRRSRRPAEQLHTSHRPDDHRRRHPRSGAPCCLRRDGQGVHLEQGLRPFVGRRPHRRGRPRHLEGPGHDRDEPRAARGSARPARSAARRQGRGHRVRDPARPSRHADRLLGAPRAQLRSRVRVTGARQSDRSRGPRAGDLRRAAPHRRRGPRHHRGAQSVRHAGARRLAHCGTGAVRGRHRRARTPPRRVVVAVEASREASSGPRRRRCSEPRRVGSGHHRRLPARPSASAATAYPRSSPRRCPRRRSTVRRARPPP